MLMTVIPIRSAETRDLAAITRISEHEGRHGAAAFELEPPSERERAHRYEGLRSGGYPYLVAQLEGEIMGYAYAGPYRARPAYRWTVEDSIYVAAAGERRGVGRGLLGRPIGEGALA